MGTSNQCVGHFSLPPLPLPLPFPPSPTPAISYCQLRQVGVARVQTAIAHAASCCTMHAASTRQPATRQHYRRTWRQPLRARPRVCGCTPRPSTQGSNARRHLHRGSGVARDTAHLTMGKLTQDADRVPAHPISSRSCGALCAARLSVISQQATAKSGTRKEAQPRSSPRQCNAAHASSCGAKCGEENCF